MAHDIVVRMICDFNYFFKFNHSLIKEKKWQIRYINSLEGTLYFGLLDLGNSHPSVFSSRRTKAIWIQKGNEEVRLLLKIMLFSEIIMQLACRLAQRIAFLHVDANKNDVLVHHLCIQASKRQSMHYINRWLIVVSSCPWGTQNFS